MYSAIPGDEVYVNSLHLSSACHLPENWRLARVPPTSAGKCSSSSLSYDMIECYSAVMTSHMFDNQKVISWWLCLCRVLYIRIYIISECPNNLRRKPHEY
jgi:hypothetical protein